MLPAGRQAARWWPGSKSGTAASRGESTSGSDRPVDGEGRIVPADGALAHRVVGGGDQIEQQGVVRAASGNRARSLPAPPPMRAVGGGQLDRGMAAVGGRIRPEIQDHVVHGALEAGQHLGLGAGRHLVVQAAQRAGPARRRKGSPARCPRSMPKAASSCAAEAAGEEAALVGVRLGLEHQHAGQGTGDQAHAVAPHAFHGAGTRLPEALHLLAVAQGVDARPEAAVPVDPELAVAAVRRRSGSCSSTQPSSGER